MELILELVTYKSLLQILAAVAKNKKYKYNLAATVLPTADIQLCTCKYISRSNQLTEKQIQMVSDYSTNVFLGKISL